MQYYQNLQMMASWLLLRGTVALVGAVGGVRERAGSSSEEKMSSSKTTSKVSPDHSSKPAVPVPPLSPLMRVNLMKV